MRRRCHRAVARSIADRVRPIHVSAANETKCDGRIELSTGDMRRGGDERGDREAMSERDGEHVVASRFDGADSDKDKSEGADDSAMHGRSLSIRKSKQNVAGVTTAQVLR